MYGTTGLTITSLCIAIAVPLLNIAAILALMNYNSGQRPTLIQMGRALIKNPVIVAIASGVLFNVSGFSLLASIDRFLRILGCASLPLGLLSVGASLELAAAHHAKGSLLLASFVKLLLVPLLTFGLGISIGLRGVELATLVLFNAAPCTPSAYIMARIFGGDYKLAAGIITLQTALAILTMPLLLLLASG
jgi:predicted permease